MPRALIVACYLALLYAAGMGTAQLLHTMTQDWDKPFATITRALP